MMEQNFGKNLKEVRKFLGMTQLQLAEKVRLEPGNLSRIEEGHNYPSLPTIVRILTVLNITFERLVGE